MSGFFGPARLATFLALLGLISIFAGPVACAADGAILEQQRLLWVLGYGTPLDGKPGSDTSKAIAQFLDKERGGSPLEGSALTEALKEVGR
jgi:hypothetical protein